ncbi:MAG: aminotransferase class IV [Bacteroidetes bacterium]|nr:aminotransferase class IV [Bacteroidota bacterium]
MSRFLETIKLLNGEFYNLEYHQQRLSDTCSHFKLTDIKLHSFLKDQSIPRKGLYKCRIVYGADQTKFECIPYHAKSVKSLKLVESDSIDYQFKWEDRTEMNQLFNQRGDADDVIVVKNGLVTDSSYANLLFWNGKNWLTPNEPLLRGTQREFLIKTELIKQTTVSISDLRKFEKVKLINSMLEMQGPEIAVSNIII